MANTHSVDAAETLKEVFRLTPLALKVKDTFQCMVCLGVMKPPVIFATCCKKLIVCKYCMGYWIPDMCPQCRGVTEDNIKLKQFDDILSFFSDEWNIAFYC